MGLALLAVAAKDLKTHVARAACLALGFALPFASTALYFWHRGALEEAIGWGILFNRSYLSEGPGLQMAASRLAAQLFGVVLPSLLFFDKQERPRLGLVVSPTGMVGLDVLTEEKRMSMGLEPTGKMNLRIIDNKTDKAIFQTPKP